MEDHNLILLTALAVAKGAALLAIPLVLTSFLWRGVTWLAPTGFAEVPIVYTFARFVGLSLGFALIYAHNGGLYFDMHRMFLPDSVWNTTFQEFLVDRVNPLHFGPDKIINHLGLEGANLLFSLMIALLALILAVAIGSCFRIWWGLEALRAALAAIGISLWLGYMTIYTMSLLFWLIYLFNFWTFLLLALVVQYYRRRSFASH
ncbi:MAG: hypothetical protein HQ483_19390 [Rhodospirillales bacterium]|nr:hypothetical protein [Rhodospirillales bacterium]